MAPLLRSVRIQGFRCLKDLNLEGLGRVNLITGKNNTGKSSVLEAVRLFALDGTPPVIHELLRNREESFGESEEEIGGKISKGFRCLSNLFSGYNDRDEIPNPISISAHHESGEFFISIAVDSFMGETDSEGKWRRKLEGLSAGTALDLDYSDYLLALILDTNGKKSIVDIEDFWILPKFRMRSNGRGPAKSSIPCEYINAAHTIGPNRLGSYWDQVILNNKEEDVLDVMRIISPDIESISMIGGERFSESRTAVVRSKSVPRPIPLRSFGEGLYRLFGIALSLVNAKGGMLLIDEVENGLHHTIQADIWKIAFQISNRLDIQVFATSHSWDSIEAFQQAAEEDPEEGVLIRLTRVGEEIVPTLFREEELKIATREGIEVR